MGLATRWCERGRGGGLVLGGEWLLRVSRYLVLVEG